MGLISTFAKASSLSAAPPTTMVVPGFTDAPPKARPFDEVGVTGLLRTRGTGFVFEEWLPQLSVNRQRQVYRQMRDNDAVIGALFFALEMILRKADWFVEASDPSAKAEFLARFVEECMQDMSHTWEDFVAEAVNMFAFGFSLFETVYKKRGGPRGKKASRFSDGLIGWRKFAPRAQESILYWMWDDEGGLQGAVQLAAPEYRTVPIPISKLLLLRTTSIKNNPEGRSVLRNCFRPWVLKTRDEEVEGIGLERDLCGMPVLYASQESIKALGGINEARRMIRNIRVDDQMGLILPQAFDEKGNRAVLFELLKAAGGKQMDAGAVIKRHNEDILNTMLAGFIQLGQTEHGARSLHLSATQIFAQAISAFMDSIAAVVNRIAIPRMLSLNPGMDLALAPRLVPGEIGGRDLEELGNYVAKLAGAGISFADRDTATVLRKKADLPEEPAESPMSNAIDVADPNDVPASLRPQPAKPPAAPPDRVEKHQLRTDRLVLKVGGDRRRAA